jgi:MFS family permease
VTSWLCAVIHPAASLSLKRIGILAAIYPATWGILQLATGVLSDSIGRKWLIATAMWIQAAGIGTVILSRSFAGFAAGAALLGIGTAMAYPTLPATIADVALHARRASAVGVYRLWRDWGMRLAHW